MDGSWRGDAPAAASGAQRSADRHRLSRCRGAVRPTRTGQRVQGGTAVSGPAQARASPACHHPLRRCRSAQHLDLALSRMEYLHSLLKFAINMSASDIHVKPGHHPTIRIAGELVPVQVDPPTAEQVAEIVRLMLPKHLEYRLDREKEADFSYIDPALGRFRVNVFYQRGLPAFVMRHVKTAVPTFHDLNLPEQLGKTAGSERAIILVTGPTGSGKSSTLAAMI